jgi:UDP-glucuronate 4-epimerase
MVRCLVTGAAGFVGSHLCEALLEAGHEVVGLDAFVPYYPRAVKEANLAAVAAHPRAGGGRFRFVERDLRDPDPAPLAGDLAGATWVFHLAAMGGLLASWTAFDGYVSCNVLATQRLLEAIRLARQAAGAAGAPEGPGSPGGGGLRLVHASTSSVYGDYVTGPEETPCRPVSPYGITKLAAEHLVQTYDAQFGVPATILRYFSVYGPRQRPDMGYYQFVERLLAGRPLLVHGDGEQRRGNTYVRDAARATLLAAERFRRGAVYNVGGAEEVSANAVIALLEELTGRRAAVERGPARPGEQQRTLADTRRAEAELGFAPRTPLREGLAAQVAWQRSLQGALAEARAV